MDAGIVQDHAVEDLDQAFWEVLNDSPSQSPPGVSGGDDGRDRAFNEQIDALPPDTIPVRLRMSGASCGRSTGGLGTTSITSMPLEPIELARAGTLSTQSMWCPTCVTSERSWLRLPCEPRRCDEGCGHVFESVVAAHAFRAHRPHSFDQVLDSLHANRFGMWYLAAVEVRCGEMRKGLWREAYLKGYR